MADPIRDALERAARELELVASSLTQAGWAAAGSRAMNEAHAARAALAAQPPAPVAWCRSDDFDAAAAKRQSFSGWREQHNDCDMALYAAPPAPASDGEREELAQWIDLIMTPSFAEYPDGVISKRLARAATLLRRPAPAPAAVPVAVAERPWQREGWCDVEGRCWWFNRAGIPEWQLADGGPYGDFCLPHWAIPIPQPPQGGEVQQ